MHTDDGILNTTRLLDDVLVIGWLFRLVTYVNILDLKKHLVTVSWKDGWMGVRVCIYTTREVQQYSLYCFYCIYCICLNSDYNYCIVCM